MPSSAASRNPIEHRCPVTLSFFACAAWMAAPSSARVRKLYALKEVAPCPAQNSTVRRASSGSWISCICGVKVPRPSRYGPVTNMRGPGCLPESISFFTWRSVYGSMLPVVRMVVTPPARYSRGKLRGISWKIAPPAG